MSSPLAETPRFWPVQAVWVRTEWKGASRVGGCRREQRSVLDRYPGHMSWKEAQTQVAKRWGTLDVIGL